MPGPPLRWLFGFKITRSARLRPLRRFGPGCEYLEDRNLLTSDLNVPAQVSPHRVGDPDAGDLSSWIDPQLVQSQIDALGQKLGELAAEQDAKAAEVADLESRRAVFGAELGRLETAILSKADRLAQAPMPEPIGAVRQFLGRSGSAASTPLWTDGKYTLAVGADAIVRLWNVQTGEENGRFAGHTRPVTGAALSTDGKLVVSASQDKTVRVWDILTGRELNRFRGNAFLSTAISPDGRLVAGGGQDRTVQIWDRVTGKLVRRLTGLQGEVNSVTFSPDGKYLLTGSDNLLRLWNLKDGSVRKLKGHTGTIRAAVFSADGKYLLSGADDKTVRLWEAGTGKEIRKFAGHTASVWNVTFTPGAAQVLSAGRDSTVRLWDAKTGTEVRKLTGDAGGRVVGLAASSDGQHALVGDANGSIQTWRISDDPAAAVRAGIEAELEALRGQHAVVLAQVQAAQGALTEAQTAADGLAQARLETEQELQRLVDVRDRAAAALEAALAASAAVADPVAEPAPSLGESESLTEPGTQPADPAEDFDAGDPAAVLAETLEAYFADYAFFPDVDSGAIETARERAARLETLASSLGEINAVLARIEAGVPSTDPALGAARERIAAEAQVLRELEGFQEDPHGRFAALADRSASSLAACRLIVEELAALVEKRQSAIIFRAGPGGATKRVFDLTIRSPLSESFVEIRSLLEGNGQMWSPTVLKLSHPGGTTGQAFRFEYPNANPALWEHAEIRLFADEAATQPLGEVIRVAFGHYDQLVDQTAGAETLDTGLTPAEQTDFRGRLLQPDAIAALQSLLADVAAARGEAQEFLNEFDWGALELVPYRLQAQSVADRREAALAIGILEAVLRTAAAGADAGLAQHFLAGAKAALDHPRAPAAATTAAELRLLGTVGNRVALEVFRSTTSGQVIDVQVLREVPNGRGNDREWRVWDTETVLIDPSRPSSLLGFYLNDSIKSGEVRIQFLVNGQVRTGETIPLLWNAETRTLTPTLRSFVHLGMRAGEGTTQELSRAQIDLLLSGIAPAVERVVPRVAAWIPDNGGNWLAIHEDLLAAAQLQPNLDPVWHLQQDDPEFFGTPGSDVWAAARAYAEQRGERVDSILAAVQDRIQGKRQELARVYGLYLENFRQYMAHVGAKTMGEASTFNLARFVTRPGFPTGAQVEHAVKENWTTILQHVRHWQGEVASALEAQENRSQRMGAMERYERNQINAFERTVRYIQSTPDTWNTPAADRLLTLVAHTDPAVLSKYFDDAAVPVTLPSETVAQLKDSFTSYYHSTNSTRPTAPALADEQWKRDGAVYSTDRTISPAATAVLDGLALPVDSLAGPWINYTGSPEHTGNSANAIDLNRLGGHTLNFDLGQPVTAPASGAVVVAHEDWKESLLILKHEAHVGAETVCYYTIYEHMQNISPRLKAEPGDAAVIKVKAGEIIGEIGSVGTGTAHLHFEVRLDSPNALSIDLTDWLALTGIKTAPSPTKLSEVGGTNAAPPPFTSSNYREVLTRAFTYSSVRVEVASFYLTALHSVRDRIATDYSHAILFARSVAFLAHHKDELSLFHAMSRGLYSEATSLMRAKEGELLRTFAASEANRLADIAGYVAGKEEAGSKLWALASWVLNYKDPIFLADKLYTLLNGRSLNDQLDAAVNELELGRQQSLQPVDKWLSFLERYVAAKDLQR